MSQADAAKLNLKISQQAQDIYDMKIKTKDTEDKLQALREEHSMLKSQKIALEMETVTNDHDINICSILFSIFYILPESYTNANKGEKINEALKNEPNFIQNSSNWSLF